MAQNLETEIPTDIARMVLAANNAPSSTRVGTTVSSPSTGMYYPSTHYMPCMYPGGVPVVPPAIQHQLPSCGPLHAQASFRNYPVVIPRQDMNTPLVGMGNSNANVEGPPPRGPGILDTPNFPNHPVCGFGGTLPSFRDGSSTRERPTVPDGSQTLGDHHHESEFQKDATHFRDKDFSEDDLCHYSQEPGNKMRKLEDSFATCHINHLPKEVMRHIFMYLFTNDKLSASLVCRAWLNVMDDSVLMDGICIKIYHVDKPRWCHRLWDLDGRAVYFSRKFVNFKFYYISADIMRYLHEYEKSFRRLTFFGSTLDQDLIKSSHEESNFCNLEKLELVFCKLNIFHNLPVLKKFSVTSHEDITLTDHDFVNWGKMMPKLESLKLDLDQKVHSFKNDSSLQYCREQPSRTTLTIPGLLDFIESHHQTLTEINIHDRRECPIKLYRKICQMKELRLKKLKLDSHVMSERIASSVIEIIRTFVTITDLELSDLGLCDEHVSAICKLLPNITSLSIAELIDYRASLKDVFRLKHLQKLSIASLYGIDNETFEEAVNVYQLNKLKRFQLTAARIQTGTLMNLLSKMTELNSLKLACRVGMTDETLRHISEHLVQLRVLEIQSEHITDGGIFCSSNPKQCLSNIKGLRKLRISNSRVSGEALLNAVKFLELQSLFLWKPSTNLPISIEDEFKKNNPSLRNFYKEGNSNKYSLCF